MSAALSSLTQPPGLLKTLLEIPTAPFREDYVIDFLVGLLRENRVPHFIDSLGNILIGEKSEAEAVKRLTLNAKRGRPTPIPFFIAHLDHPGFHGVKWQNSDGPQLEKSRKGSATVPASSILEVKWFGGAPVEDLVGAKVRATSRRDPNIYFDGVIRSFQLAKNKKTIDSAVLSVESTSAGWRDSSKQSGMKSSAPLATDFFGGFYFRSAFWQEKDLYYTNAADDLIGAYAILTLALLTKKRPLPFLALLSRGEEVGFIGTIGHLSLPFWKKLKSSSKNSANPLVVSLETSRQLPNAEIGKGPIVRLGDRASVFHSGYTQALSELAGRVLPQKHQRRIMDGGTCEATAALAFGLPAIGISVPLGNYHNQNFEGGPDSRAKNGPAPEFVHAEDLSGMICLIKAIVTDKTFKSDCSDPFKKKRTELIRNFLDFKKYLVSCSAVLFWL